MITFNNVDVSKFLDSIRRPIMEHKINKIMIDRNIQGDTWIIDETVRTIYISNFTYQKLELFDYPQNSGISTIYGIPLVRHK